MAKTRAQLQKEWRLRNPERAAEQRSRSNKKITTARRALLDEIKLTRGCTDCGYNKAPEALHFDHRSPNEKSFTISSNLTTNWEKVLLEVAKCDVRCANCHAIRTRLLGHGKR